MSRILHLVNMSQRYRGSKGVRESQQEEPPWTSLAAPCHLEESASHDFSPSAWMNVERCMHFDITYLYVTLKFH